MKTEQKTKLRKFLNYIAKHPILSLIRLIVLILAGALTWLVTFTDNATKLWNMIRGTGISYEVISISRFAIDDLEGYAKSEGLDSFNLSLDDSILPDYYIIKLRLKNRSRVLDTNVKFDVSLGKEFVKILDIKHKVSLPVHKKIVITYSIPDVGLRFKTKVENIHTLRWDAPETRSDGTPMTATDIAGYNIYRSKFEEVGFGKINVHLIKQTFFSLGFQERNFFPAWYAVEVVDSYGQRSERTKALPIPGSYAFNPESYNVIKLGSDLRSIWKAGKTGEIIFTTLDQEVEKEEKKAIFFVDKYRDTITSNLDRKGVSILYLDDFKFLKGKANIYVSSGLDKNAEIIFYYLYKNLSGSEHNIDMNLEGHPDVEFYKSSSNAKYNFRLRKDDVLNEEIDKKKYLLTPSVVTTCLGNRVLYILWEYPKDKGYKGVRLFRKQIIDNNGKVEPEDEVYDGTGTIKKIRLINRSLHSKGKDNSAKSNRIPESYTTNINIPAEPPLRRSETVKLPPPPAAPRIRFTDESDELYLNDGQLMPFFADNYALLHGNYIYVLYAYDDQNHYSYPVLINASFADISSALKCEAVD